MLTNDIKKFRSFWNKENCLKKGDGAGCTVSDYESSSVTLYLAMDGIESILGPVVQRIVSLTTSLIRQLVKYMPTTLSNTLYFLLKKNLRIFCNAKDYHIFPTKNSSVFEIFKIKIITKR